MSIRFGERSDKATIEGGLTLAPKFNADGLIPVVTTCALSGKVLMQAWMNAEALEATITTGEGHYYSRSRAELWHKGATSGQIQTVKSLKIDCDQDSLWMSVDQAGGGACHTGTDTCFYRDIPVGVSVNGTVKMVKK